MLLMRAARLRPLLPFLALLTILGAVAAAYYPGLSGPFLLDDLSALPKLGAYGPVDNPTTFVSYVTDGIAGPTGRPLALASFLMDAHDWPANPWPFKLTNLLLHLLNGVLLAILLRLLSRAAGLDVRKAAWAGVLGAGFWLLHPLFVSTTLYVVQRMAELAALFVVAGLILYTTGRNQMLAGRNRRGYLLMAGGLVGGTCIGVLAKENAVLLPVLAGVLEITVFACADRRRHAVSDVSANRPRGEPSRAFRWLFLGLPTLAILGFLLWNLRNIATPLPNRDFTVGTRLLTEPRVLVQYLYLLVVPHAGTSGLYTTISVSRGLLSPWQTLPAILVVLSLVLGGFALRRRHPVIAAAILFFFAGQLIESTTVPLELYFEHRNYLPAMLLFWPLAVGALDVPVSRTLKIGGIGTIVLVLAGLTAYRANLWGNGVELALTWMRLNPNAPRAQVWGARALSVTGHPTLALARLRTASRVNPDDVSIALSRLKLACETNQASRADLAGAVGAARRARAGSRLIYDNLAKLAARVRENGCGPITAQQLISIPEAALDNPRFRRNPALRQEFLVLKANLLLDGRKRQAAFSTFNRAVALRPRPGVVLTAAAAMLRAHAPAQGLRLLDRYDHSHRPVRSGWTMARLHQWWLERIGWYRQSFKLVRRALHNERAKQVHGAAP